MKQSKEPKTILIADDNPDDRKLIQNAFEKVRSVPVLHLFEDGEELLDYLYCRGNYTQPAAAPWPSLILVDLNMPKKGGREILLEIKAHPELRRVPVVVLTTSKAKKDILHAYNLGVSSYIIKPVKFEALVDIVATLAKYWLEIVELPPPNRKH